MNRCNSVLLLQLLRCFIVIVGVVLLPSKLLAQKSSYTPKALLIPLHDQKKQFHFSLGRGGGYDFNVSYAFTNRLAIFSTVVLDNDTKKRISIFGDRYNVDRNDFVFKGGLGYFTKTVNPLFPLLEAYLGAGTSKIDNYWYYTGNTYGNITQARYRSIFGQFNAGKRMLKSNYGIGLRLTYSEYTDFIFYDTNNTSVKSRYENLRGLTADPAISGGYNLYGFSINAQLGAAFPLFNMLIDRTDTHTYVGAPHLNTTINSKGDKAQFFSFIGRLSVQYNLNLDRQR